MSATEPSAPAPGLGEAMIVDALMAFNGWPLDSEALRRAALFNLRHGDTQAMAMARAVRAALTRAARSEDES